MLKNSGKQIKAIAIWIMLCFSLISLLVAVLIWKSLGQGFLGFLVLFFGISMAWSSVILLYGYGDLIDETTKNRQESEKTNQLLEQLINYNLPQGEKPVSPAAPVPHATPTDTASSSKNKFRYPEKRESPTTNTPSGWLCPKCGSRNSELTMSCKTCGSTKETQAQHNNGVVRKTAQNKITTEPHDIPVTQTPVFADGWTCKECGKKNSSTSISCKSCGALR